MGGYGAQSASARARETYEFNRRALLRNAELAESSGERSARARDYARTARAAAGIVGTEKGFSLVENSEFKRLERIVDDLKGGPVMPLSIVEGLLEPGFGNRPLFMSAEQWESTKTEAQGIISNLTAGGYTVEEIAAGATFGRYLRRV